MRSSLWLAASVGLVACGPQVAGTGGDTDGTGGDATSADYGGAGVGDGAPNTTSPPQPPPGSTTGFDDTTGASDEGVLDTAGFIADCDAGFAPPGTKFHCSSVPEDCDPIAQDCPRGEKCVPWANDGGAVWNANKCLPIPVDPAGLDEPCTLEGSSSSGLDDCDLGSMCFPDDWESLTGSCIALCSGSTEMPTCGDEASCVITNMGVMPLCLPYCSPLVQDCLLGTCRPMTSGTGSELLCDLGYEPGVGLPGEACASAQECTPGTTCSPAAEVPGCAGAACCSSFCDLLAPDPAAACLAGQACEPWYAAGRAPLFGDETIGICTGA
jgi:hypothetical protein